MASNCNSAPQQSMNIYGSYIKAEYDIYKERTYGSTLENISRIQYNNAILHTRIGNFVGSNLFLNIAFNSIQNDSWWRYSEWFNIGINHINNDNLLGGITYFTYASQKIPVDDTAKNILARDIFTLYAANLRLINDIPITRRFLRVRQENGNAGPAYYGPVRFVFGILNNGWRNFVRIYGLLHATFIELRGENQITWRFEMKDNKDWTVGQDFIEIETNSNVTSTFRTRRNSITNRRLHRGSDFVDVKTDGVFI